MSHEVNKEVPRITAEMVPLRARGLFTQTDEMLKAIDVSLQESFRFGLAGHIHGPEFGDHYKVPEHLHADDPGFDDALEAYQEENEATDDERTAEVDIEQLRSYLNFWVTSAAVIYRHFGGRSDSFPRAEALADEVLDDLHL
jgi:hypothetical protein